MQEIPLTQNQVALVDDSDYEFLSQWRWFACKHRSGNFYAKRHTQGNEKRTTIHMSRQILGLERGDKRQADHINHITLDNQLTNLRICTSQQNQMNRETHIESSSIYKGVSWDKKTKKWLAQIQVQRKNIHLGRFRFEELAALAYDFAAMRYFKGFAKFNF